MCDEVLLPHQAQEWHQRRLGRHILFGWVLAAWCVFVVIPVLYGKWIIWKPFWYFMLAMGWLTRQAWKAGGAGAQYVRT